MSDDQASAGVSYGMGKWVVAGLLGLTAATALALVGTASLRVPAAAAGSFLAENSARDGVVVTKSGLQYEVLAAGEGEHPRPDDVVAVHYVGRLADGTVFDSSLERGEPAIFPVNGVIPGWTEGLQLMRPGAKYRFTIPPELGYGARTGGPIPPNSVLQFDVQLLAIAPREQ